MSQKKWQPSEIRSREVAVDVIADELDSCHDDPSRFNDLFLGGPPFWSGKETGHHGQVEWCDALVRYRCLAIETGNALGKDYWISRIIPWWLYTRPGSLVIVTGPGQTVLGSVTWKEVRRAIEGTQYGKPPIPLGCKISSGIKTSPHTVDLGAGWQALGFSTTTVERASGQHAGELLVIVEEASGAEPNVWESVESLKYTKLVAIGNPLRAEGGFVDLCLQGESDRLRGVPERESCCYLNTPSTASPDASEDQSHYGLADRIFLEASERKYGFDSLWFRAHILAVRPTLLNEQLISEEDLDRCVSFETHAAVEAARTEGKGGRRRLGCDVGEGCGNARTVIFVRDELGILEISASRYQGPREAAEVMARLAEKWKVSEENVSYDGAGQTGKRLGNSLASKGLGRAKPYFGSSSGGRRCSNLRTACALALARRLDPDHYRGSGTGGYTPFAIPITRDWESIREEILGLRYHLDKDLSCLELKEDFMDRLGRSPDFCDALTQTFRDEAIAG